MLFLRPGPAPLALAALRQAQHLLEDLTTRQSIGAGVGLVGYLCLHSSAYSCHLATPQPAHPVRSRPLPVRMERAGSLGRGAGPAHMCWQISPASWLRSICSTHTVDL